MKILSFAFNGEKDNLYLPENVNENSVCFTGTHDNDTLMGLIENSSEWDYNNLITGVKESLKIAKINHRITDNKSLANGMIKLGVYSKSKLFVMPFADLLKKHSDYRINEPGTTKEQNWSVRFEKKDFSKKAQNYLLKLTKKYKR
jgi:4-alpha-glucanotransferase